MNENDKALIRSIFARVPGEHKFNDNGGWAYIIDDPLFGYYAKIEDGSIHVSIGYGKLNEHLPYDMPHDFSMSAALAKSPERIAREIVAKLTDPAIPVAQAAVSRKRDYDQKVAQGKANAENLVALGEGLLMLGGSDAYTHSVHMSVSENGHFSYGDLRVSYESVQLDRLSVPFAVAQEIVKAMAKAKVEGMFAR